MQTREHFAGELPQLWRGGLFCRDRTHASACGALSLRTKSRTRGDAIKETLPRCSRSELRVNLFDMERATAVRVLACKHSRGGLHI